MIWTKTVFSTCCYDFYDYCFKYRYHFCWYCFIKGRRMARNLRWRWHFWMPWYEVIMAPSGSGKNQRGGRRQPTTRQPFFLHTGSQVRAIVGVGFFCVWIDVICGFGGACSRTIKSNVFLKSSSKIRLGTHSRLWLKCFKIMLEWLTIILNIFLGK